MSALALLSLAFIGYTYVGYALLLRLLPARRNDEAVTEPAEWPRISVVIAACNEAAAISTKLDDIASLDYPPDRLEVLVGSDGSTDATEVVAKGHPIGARVYSYDHLGKTAVLTRLAGQASGSLLVFMDVRQRVTKDALRRFAMNLQHPDVAAVGGELALTDANGLETSDGVGVYWKYEKWLRHRESDLGMLSGLSGALYAMRKELFEPPSDDTILDDVMIPLAPARKGYRLVVDDAIRMFDRVADEDREFRRKVRTLVGNFQMFGRLIAHPRPFPAGLAFSVFSHKACRALTPLALMGLLAGSALMPPGWFRTTLLAGQAVVYGLGLASLFSGGRLRGKLVSVCSTFCVLNAAAAVAMVKYATGRYRTTWK